MSIEEDIGGLKADMITVKDQTSKIFSKIDLVNSNLTTHSTQTLVRLDVIEERHDALSEHVESRVDPHIKNFVKARASATGLFVGIGTAAGFASGAIFDALKVFWKGDP